MSLPKEKTRPSWQSKEFDKPLLTANYFGFTPITAPRITASDEEATSHCLSPRHFDATEKAALIRTYLEGNISSLPHPLSLIYRRPRQAGYSLHLIGIPSGIAEAILIRTAVSILNDEGHKNLRVELNCVGDKDSQAAYEKELQNYFKKFGGGLGQEAKESLKKDIFNLFRTQSEEMIQFRSAAPSALAHLSAPSRNHFKEVLEYVEAIGVEFGLSPELVGDKHHSSHTIFAIRSKGPETERAIRGDDFLAVGYRYSKLTRKFGFKKELPMVGLTLESTGKKTGAEKRLYRELPKPKFYLIQLGREAKARTLGLLELLRVHRIPVHHFLGKDKLSVQLQNAEELKVSHLIIIGHKEALDGTATIRNMLTRAQDNVAIELLPQYLKNLNI